MPPHALVTIATYNQVPLLRRALRGYLRQSVGDFALVVADDGSGPETRAYVESVAAAFAERGIGLLHVWQEDRGFRKCRILNEAVRRAPVSPLLVFTDGDCIPPAHFVERHLDAHEPLSFHVAGAFRLEREVAEGITEADVDAGAFEGLGSQRSWKDLRKKRRQSIWGTRVGRRHRPKILGLNMALDRTLFESLNGFDERFESWGLGEDSDLRDRAMRHRPRPRVKVLYTRNDVYHLWHPVGKNQRAASAAYYRRPRPLRCEEGLVQP